MFRICETFGKSDGCMSAAGVRLGTLGKFSVQCNVKALVVIGREGDDVDVASVRKITGENDVNAAVSAGGLRWGAHQLPSVFKHGFNGLLSFP